MGVSVSYIMLTMACTSIANSRRAPIVSTLHCLSKAANSSTLSPSMPTSFNAPVNTGSMRSVSEGTASSVLPTDMPSGAGRGGLDT